MDFDVARYIQLTAGLALGVIVFAVGYTLNPRITVPALILLIPFQLVESRFGTSNMVLTYLLAFALLLTGNLRRVPVPGLMLLIVFAYLLSYSQVHPAQYGDHFWYVVSLLGGFLVLIMVYNVAFNMPSAILLRQTFLWCNALVVIYCAIQLMAGFERVSLFDIPQLSLTRNVQGRLVGPFNGPGLTAEFLVISIFFVVYELFVSRRVQWRLPLIALLAADLAVLVGTGNRGGFLVLLGGGALFLFAFRRELGVRGVLLFAIGGPVLLAAAVLVMITYTPFDRLASKLPTTRIDGGVPDTRTVTWPTAWKAIKDKPLLGHGPRLRLYQDSKRRIPGHEPIPYPHSLYLYLLYTVGVVGFIAFVAFFVALLLRLRALSRTRRLHDSDRCFARFGALVLVIVLVDQIKVEFLRLTLSDYQHFVFALLGMFLGAGDGARARAALEQRAGDDTYGASHVIDESSPLPSTGAR